MRFASIVLCLIALIVPRAAFASGPAPPASGRTQAEFLWPVTAVHDPYRGLFDGAPASGTGAFTVPLPPAAMSALVDDPAQTAAPRVAVEYSDAYKTRLKIHKIASFATLPLFATELLIGQSLYDNGGSGTKTAHIIVGAGIGTLFGINTVTGVWNLWESRHDPEGRTKRFAHSILMLAADAGFFATAATGPNSRHADFSDARSTHRTIAITSIGLGTAGYLIMLLGK